MIALKEMDNRGFEKEDRRGSDGQIHPAAPAVENQNLAADCPCVESQTDCSCGKTKHQGPKTEVKTWVKPKGLLLVGVSVALIAWCTIYFTLNALDLL